MRRCSNCDSLTDYFEAECLTCHYFDPAWGESLRGESDSAQGEAAPVEDIRQEGCSSRLFVIPVSPFSDSAELAYELDQARATAIESDAEIRFDFTPMGFAWDAAGEEEEYEFIPRYVGILGLTEACRAMHTARRDFPDARISAVLPPRKHPASALLIESGVLSALESSEIHWSQDRDSDTASISSTSLDIETVVPFTSVGPETSGQLSNLFHRKFDSFVEKGAVKEELRSPIRQVAMDIAENGAEYGQGCHIACFLRQERGLSASERRLTYSASFDPRLHTHLFINCFTLGPSLAEKTGYSSEWEAAQAILGGFTSREEGGGSGIKNIVQTVIEDGKGTVYFNSKSYVRLVLPTGISHEYTFGGDHYLPGVHFCLLIPLAVVSRLRQSRDT